MGQEAVGGGAITVGADEEVDEEAGGEEEVESEDGDEMEATLVLSRSWTCGREARRIRRAR